MIERISDRIYIMQKQDETDRPVLGLVIGEKGCLVIDAGNSPKHARECKQEIEAMNLPPVKYLVLTHHHWDHIFGLEEWDVVSIAHEKTNEYITTYCSIKYDDGSLANAVTLKIFKDFSVQCIKVEIDDRNNFLPRKASLTFQDHITIDLGGITCQIDYITSPHTDDSTIIYVPEENILFLGDCIYGYMSQGFNYYNREETDRMVTILEQYEAEYYVISHELVWTKEQMTKFLQCLRMGSQITKNCNNEEEAKQEFIRSFHREPTREDLFFIKSFGVGEGWNRVGNLEHEIF